MLVINEILVVLSILQPEHMIFILLAILLLFGGKKIPELMRGMGSGIKEFKDAVKEEDKKPENQNQDNKQA